MSVPNQSVRPTPQNRNPRDTVCLQIEVPNDREWIGAYYDAVEQLSYWFAWDRDEGHTGRDIAERWWRAFLSIRKCNPEQPMDGCCDGSEDQLIRQNPDNPCLLESSSDGIHWCTLFDQSLCVPANGQPGSGSRQPIEGGGQECYHADFPSTMQWNLPTVVNSGDTIEVNHTDGQATDAPNHVWYCPNGQIFFAGKCVSIPFTQAGDPAVAANHMTIVCEIAGIWYSCDSLITVPGGVSNQPVVFQVNDGVLSDNSGGYSFDVCVTNNQTGPWSHDIIFALSPQDFVTLGADACQDGGGEAKWVGGSGWKVNDCTNGSGSFYRSARIKLNIGASTHITALSIKWDSVTNPAHTSAVDTSIYWYNSGGGASLWATDSTPDGTDQVLAVPSAQDVYALAFVLDVDTQASYGALLGSGTIKSFHVEGTGPDPFV